MKEWERNVWDRQPVRTSKFVTTSANLTIRKLLKVKTHTSFKICKNEKKSSCIHPCIIPNLYYFGIKKVNLKEIHCNKWGVIAVTKNAYSGFKKDVNVP